ncbi:TylF/MycF family methyltransferase [Nocardioides sp.]|uniref:TylF/MycF family methyltransferase n=1 Tax=Nocardioides sp. TaxID=35761 RepID=UPI0035193B2B
MSSPASLATGPAVDLYLTTMAKMLTRYGFEGRNVTVKFPGRSYEGYLWNLLRIATRDRDVRIVESGEFDAERRANGRDWPADAETMVGLKRLANVRQCLESVIADGVPGDFIETGAWRGGTCIYARAVLAAHGVTDRTVWVADSFQGLPAPDGRFEADAGDQHHTKIDLAISVEQVQENFARYELLDDQVKFLKGWFSDTLPTAPVEQIAVLRLDGDMYASTVDALEPLYDKVPVGGYIIVDDYGAVKGCAQAIHDFREARGITDEIHEIDWAGVYWRKS